MSDTNRLPCRGCMSNCANYAQCDGKLWRLAPEKTAQQNEQILKSSAPKVSALKLV